jgi:hypothetical protein
MYGEVAWMDSLSNQYFGGWVIEHTIKGIPRIREITERESYIHLKLPESVTPKAINVTAIEDIVTEVQKNDTTTAPKQGVLFEF